MLRSIFTKTLWDQRRSFLWWAIGLSALSLYTAGLYPSIATPEFTSYVNQLPTALTALFGESFSLATAEGYLNAYFFDLMGPILFVIYGIAAGSGAIAGEEERGTLDVLLANPLERWLVVVHKFVAMVVGMFILAFFLWASLAVTVVLVNLDIDYSRLAQACLSGALLGIAFGALALALGCLRGSRGFSIGGAAAVTLIAYVVKTYAPLVEAMKPYEKLSPFYYANAAKPLINGINVEHAAVLIGLTIILLLASVVAFQRRDVAV